MLLLCLAFIAISFKSSTAFILEGQRTNAFDIFDAFTDPERFRLIPSFQMEHPLPQSDREEFIALLEECNSGHPGFITHLWQAWGRTLDFEGDSEVKLQCIAAYRFLVDCNGKILNRMETQRLLESQEENIDDDEIMHLFPNFTITTTLHVPPAEIPALIANYLATLLILAFGRILTIENPEALNTI